jgi:hypothetical protein
MLRIGRAVFDFEDTLQYHPGNLFTRSFYRRQLEQYLDHFARDQIHIVIFGEFVEHTQQVINEVCGFLGFTEPVDVGQGRPTRTPHRSRGGRSCWSGRTGCFAPSTRSGMHHTFLAYRHRLAHSKSGFSTVSTIGSAT